MQLSLQNFTTLVQNAAASVQASSSQLLDLTVGSALRAVLEANASLGLWMQWLIVQVMQLTRAATSVGADLDTWLADFGVTRLPAVAATGTVTIGRYTALGSVTIPVGLLVRTQDGSQTFAVTARPSVTGYSATASGYVMLAGVYSMAVPVVAQTAGTGGNVLAGTITLIVSATPGVDTVVNQAPLAGGIDVESDAAVRTRFQSFLDTRSQATPLAIGYAVQGVQQGLTYFLQENVDTTGAVRPGNFIVTVDDGSGNPSPTLIAAVTQAVDAVRPVGTTFTAQGPVVTDAAIAMTLGLPASADRPSAVAAVTGAVESYVNALAVGAPLALTRLAQVAYDAWPAVNNVSGLTINGSGADLVVGATGVVKAGQVVVS
jgi:uncharacterized phage protein gp47/JayE